jgi:sec-independent protein translocase protein TatA
MFEDLGIEKILLILLVIVVLFGAKKIPDLAQGLGKGIREFKKALRDVDDDIKMPDNKSEKKNEEK